jgi:farnesyl-diphosphate farnesyltransferase
MTPIQTRLFGHLQNTSRSFFLGISQLSEPLKTQICLGYLLCRIFDCFEDATSVSPHLRKNLLVKVLNIFEQIPNCDVQEFLSEEDWYQMLEYLNGWDSFKEKSSGDFKLLEDGFIVFNEISKLSPDRKKLFIETLKPMAEGMIEEIQKRQIEKQFMPRSERDFEKYCYWVAGTVGEFLTGLFYSEGVFQSQWSYDTLKEKGRHFGHGLQVVNIAKDFFKDWQEGRCFWMGIDLPLSTKLEPPPVDVLKNQFSILQQQFEGIQPSVESYLEAISSHRNDVRFFCEFPFEMAKETMAQGSRDLSWLEKQTTFKVNRTETFGIMNRVLGSV